ESPVHQLEGQVEVAGQPAGSASFASRHSPAQTLASPPPGANKPRHEPFEVTLSRSGAGRLYYNVRLRYAVAPDSVPAADAGLSVERQYFVQHGKHWERVGPDIVLERCDIVRVVLAVDAPTERHHVVL